MSFLVKWEETLQTESFCLCSCLYWWFGHVLRRRIKPKIRSRPHNCVIPLFSIPLWLTKLSGFTTFSQALPKQTE
jgi:hypothetical protein